MSRWVNIPKQLLDEKGKDLSLEARRMAVTAWAICDDTGFVPEESLRLATLAWGERIHAARRCTVGDILRDMEDLGFCESVTDAGNVFRFKRSSGWLTHVSAGQA